MDAQAKKCDVCGNVEYGVAVNGWYGYCSMGEGLFMSGPLRSMKTSLSRFVVDPSHISECCSPMCLIKISARLEVKSMVQQGKKIDSLNVIHVSGS